MARRLATEYVNICLKLPEEDLSGLENLLKQQNDMISHVKILSNGNHEVIVNDPISGESLVLKLEQEDGGRWISRARCRLSNPKLADTMRKIIRKFQGDAISRRIYKNFTVVYYYAQGKVAKILEITEHELKIIYENKEKQLQQLFSRLDVEQQIERVYRMIDMLLDQRLQTVDAKEKQDIDKRLKQAVDQLFYLEA